MKKSVFASVSHLLANVPVKGEGTMEIKLNLPYEHTVIYRHQADDRTVVLVRSNYECAVQPFVTYRVDKDGNCYWGHYLRNLVDAVEDYKARIA
jgi:hypothetical protein